MPKLKIILPDHQEHIHEVHEDLVTIGRLPDNSLPLEDASVSSHHAQLKHEGGEYKLVDLDSTNGTFVNDQQITTVTLRNGDAIRFGKIETVFFAQEVASADKQPLPSAGATDVTLGTASARPANFSSASPFPKTAKSGNGLSIAAIGLAVLGALGFAVAVVLSLGLSATA
jgi:pSer/pThr/pTyr-binding forkhead associated (FHA) protein